MTTKKITTTVSVKLTEDEIWWILNWSEHGHEAIGDDDDTCLHLAKKLQRRLKERGLKRPHSFGRGDKPMPTIKDMIKALKKGRVRFNF